jgi:putative transposase
MQLIAGQTGQQFNNRKDRHGAFWQDRYHATAVQSDSHLRRCLVYIDLNMVRAGVVEHPSQWLHSGYHEIQSPPKRYGIIDLGNLIKLCGFDRLDSMQAAHKNWVDGEISAGHRIREPCWTTEKAVGCPDFLSQFDLRTRRKTDR